MSKFILRSDDFSGSWTHVTTISDSASYYIDTGLDPTKSYLYKVISASSLVTKSISDERYMPWQYYTGSIYSVSLKYINSDFDSDPNYRIFTSASYTASYTGSMSGWVTGIPSQSISQYKIRFNVVSDAPYVQATASLSYNTIQLNNSKSYADSYTGSFVGRVSSSLEGNISDYYIQGYSGNTLVGTSSICVADIVFDNTDYTLPYDEPFSGSIKNLSSGSMEDYTVVVYRFAPGDGLYVTWGATPTASLTADGQWYQPNNWDGGISRSIVVKLFNKASKQIMGAAGFYPNGEYFNAGVNGYYITKFNAGLTDDAGFTFDDFHGLGTGEKVAKIIRKSDGVVLGSSNSTIPYSGSWDFSTTSTLSKLFRVASGSVPVVIGGTDTGSYLAESKIGTGLVTSYWTKPGEALRNKCFLYDQGVAMAVASNLGDYTTAEFLVRGALSALTGSASGSWPTNGTWALTGSQWAFGASAWNSVFDDPNYRTGAQMWVASGLSHFCEIFPTSSLVNEITSSLKDFWQTMFDYYWCGPSGSGLWSITGSAADYVASEGLDGDSAYIENTQSYSGSGLQFNSFLGGAGQYVGITFDPNYVIPWSSCEHNTDAWFALRSSARVIGGSWSSSLAASASLLGYSLANNFWYASGSQNRQQTMNSQSRGYQGLTNPYKPDDAHALDVGSWYGLFLRAYGEMGKFSASMATLPEYRLLDPVGGVAYGYTPYLTRYPDYAAATPTLWVEGSAGVILAYRAATSHSFAFSEYQQLLPVFSGSYWGFPYTTLPDGVFELGNSGSIVGNLWMILAENPKGFWEVDF